MARRDVSTKFDIITQIGESSLFTVYKARDRSNGALVTFKVVRPPYAANAQFLANLRLAAQNAARLPHPGLARTYYADEAEGSQFVLCEFVTGQCLQKKLANEAPFPEQEALALTAQIAEALSYLHQNGLTHADLRPQHIFLTQRGDVKVTDTAIGAASLMVPNLPHDYLLRTVPFMAPEVAAGGAPSAASDLYALGVLLYYMITGKVPFEGYSPAEIARKHAEAAPSLPSQLNPGLSRYLEDVIMKLLEKKPEDRYPSAAQLARDVEQIAAGHPPTVVTAAVPEGGEAPPSRAGQVPDVFIAPAPPRPRATANVATRLLYGLLAIGMMLIVAAGFFLYAWFPKTKEVKVPDIVGKPLPEARNALDRLNLTSKVRSHEFSDTVTENLILRSDPTPGETVKEGREIALDVSDGPNLVGVPDLRELSVEKAQKLIRARGLKVDPPIYRYSDTIPKGSVVGQAPGGGTKTKKGSPVGLFISKGPEPATGGNPPTEPPPPTKVDDDSLIREISMQVEVPASGATRQQVKIVVNDRRGATVAYEQYHKAGEKVTKSLEIHGKEARIQVFVAGVMVEQDRVLPDNRVVKE